MYLRLKAKPVAMFSLFIGRKETQTKAFFVSVSYTHLPSQSMKIVTGLSYKYDYKGKWNTSAFVKHYMNHLEAVSYTHLDVYKRQL